MKMKSDYYRVKDLSAAAFLYSSGMKLVRLEKEDGKCWFIFENHAACDELANSYWLKIPTVNAKEFSDSLKYLKDLIFNK